MIERSGHAGWEQWTVTLGRDRYLLAVPDRLDPDAAPVVSIHGISNNAAEHLALTAPIAADRGAITVAPDLGDHARYQRLGRRRHRADLAVDRMVDDARNRVGVRADVIDLLGYSGGAQFAHRYLLAHPSHVRRCVVAAAGWYTFPDIAPFPAGLGVDPGRWTPEMDLVGALDVPTLVAVGSRDTSRSGALRSSPELDAQQGRHRVDRARRWVALMHDAAVGHGREPLVELLVLRGVSHNYARSMRLGLGAAISAFLTDRDRETVGV